MTPAFGPSMMNAVTISKQKGIKDEAIEWAAHCGLGVLAQTAEVSSLLWAFQAVVLAGCR